MRLSVVVNGYYYHPVAKNGFLSGSDYVYIHSGARIVRSNSMFGPMNTFTAVGVEGGERFPVLVVRDDKGVEVRLTYQDHYIAGGQDKAPASGVIDMWIVGERAVTGRVM